MPQEEVKEAFKEQGEVVSVRMPRGESTHKGGEHGLKAQQETHQSTHQKTVLPESNLPVRCSTRFL